MARSKGDSFSRTPLSMAPEPTMTCEVVDSRSHPYSSGAVAHYLLTGQPPFTGTNVVQLLAAHASNEVAPPSTIIAEIPADLEVLILKSLAKKASGRFPDALSMERALAQCTVANAWTPQKAEGWWNDHSPKTENAIDDDESISKPNLSRFSTYSIESTDDKPGQHN